MKFANFTISLLMLLTVAYSSFAEPKPDTSMLKHTYLTHQLIAYDSSKITNLHKMGLWNDNIVIVGLYSSSNPDEKFLNVNLYDFDLNLIWTRKFGYYNNDKDFEIPRPDDMTFLNNKLRIWGVASNRYYPIFHGTPFYLECDETGECKYQLDTTLNAYELNLASSAMIDDKHIVGVNHRSSDSMYIQVEFDTFMGREDSTIVIDTITQQDFFYNKVKMHNDSTLICVTHFLHTLANQHPGMVIHLISTDGKLLKKEYIETGNYVNVVNFHSLGEDNYLIVLDELLKEKKQEAQVFLFYNINTGVYKRITVDTSSNGFSIFDSELKDNKVLVGGIYFSYKSGGNRYYKFYVKEFTLEGELLLEEKWGGDYDQTINDVMYAPDGSIIVVGNYNATDYHVNHSTSEIGLYLARMVKKTTEIQDSNAPGDASNSIRAIPSIASDKIRIESNRGIEYASKVIIFNIMGMKVSEFDNWHLSIPIEVSNLPSGIYNLQILTGSTNIKQCSFIIQR